MFTTYVLLTTQGRERISHQEVPRTNFPQIWCRLRMRKNVIFFREDEKYFRELL